MNSFTITIGLFIAGSLVATVVAMYWIVSRERRMLTKLQAEMHAAQLDAAAKAAAVVAPLPTGAKPAVTDPPPPPLIDACAQGGCVLFTGAGIGMLAGLPSWRAALEEVIDANADLFSEETARGMRSLLARREYDVVTELLEVKLERIPLMLAIGEQFDKAKPPPALEKLVDGIPFSAFLTTNFDDMLDKVVAVPDPLILTPRSSYDFAALIRETEPFILKLHGEIVSPHATTLTMSELRASLDEAGNLRAALRAIFETRTLLFLGVGVQTIERLCDAIGFLGTTNQRHYAVVLDDGDFEARAERLALFGIELLRLARPSEIINFIDELTAEVEEQRQHLPDNAEAYSALAPTRVLRAKLENIGPFKQVELDFLKPWTLILGNNGAGKSTVLRAIALALCGADGDARKEGRALLRRGELKGSIEVTLAAGSAEMKCLTQISSEGREGVMVRAHSAPLQAGTMAAFGFPAIRGLPPIGSFDPTQEESHRFPRTEDVLPLIRGGVDDRGRNLRRWIFNLYVRSEDRALGETIRAHYRDTIGRFFELINEMTPGFNLRFLRCDTETYEILLDTSDGEVPLDYVSQGMNSTMGWAGILMQRLSEIFPGEADPLAQHALLLIDEIDSHLHPAWQMNLVPILKQHFPNLQVIATTHSPLMVGNLEEHEVIRVARDADGLTIEHLAQSFKGYRADQILTDQPFEMESTRAKSWEAMREEYATLLAMPERSAENEARLADLVAALRQVPPPFESRAERNQAEELQTALREAIQAVAADDELLHKLKHEVLSPGAGPRAE
ncbi:MAG TPA: AAA family ATPase [Allosphingosinicella sp.]|nr:AAA family ATPase [Allosphingosinicella sp.]